MMHLGWCLLAATLYVLAFPPADLGFLGFVALWPWCRMARKVRGWRLFGLGYLAGVMILTAGCWWLRKSSPINLVLMVVPEALYFGFMAVVLRRGLVTHRLPAWIVLPVVYVAMELGRSRFPLDGFPWLLLGYSQHAWLPLLQISDLVGVMGVSALLAMTAGAADHWWEHRGEREGRRGLIAIAVLLIGAHAYGFWRLGQEIPGRAGPRLLLVQPNIEQKLKDSTSKQGMIDQRHRFLTRAGLSAAEPPADLVVWSETMLPVGLVPRRGPSGEVWSVEYDYTAAKAHAREVGLLSELSQELLQPAGAWLLTGAMTAEGDEREDRFRMYNSAILYDPAGQRRGLYDKVVLVPGGEYLPWVEQMPEGFRRWLRRRVEDMAGFVPNLLPGAGPVILDVPHSGGEAAVGPTICYEIAYPDFGRQVVAGGAEVLVNLSNEAWFPDSAEFEQYTAMAAFRATEVRRDVVRCANSGTSGIVDAHGRVTAMEEGGRRDGFEGTMLVQPQLRTVSTLYARWGDWLAWLALAAAAAVLLPRRKPAG